MKVKRKERTRKWSEEGIEKRGGGVKGELKERGKRKCEETMMGIQGSRESIERMREREREERENVKGDGGA